MTKRRKRKPDVLELPRISDYLLTMPQTAKILGVCVRSVQRTIDTGDLDSLILGRRSRRIRYSAVLDYIRRMEEGVQRAPRESQRQLTYLSSPKADARHD